MRISASISRLQEIKDVTKEDAQEIKRIWKTRGRRQARDLIDEKIRTSGVEYLGHHKRRSEPVYYCNGGDTYATTIIFIGDELTVGCIGDLIEKNLILEPYQI